MLKYLNPLWFVGFCQLNFFDSVFETVGDVFDTAVDIIEPIAKVASFIPGPWQMPAMAFNAIDSLAQGNVLGAIGSAVGASGVGGAGSLFSDAAPSVVYDASGMAIDAASVADGSVELLGGMAYDASGNVLGSAVDVAGQVVQQGAGSMSSIMSGAKTLGNIAKVGSNLYNAYQGFNTQTPGQAQSSADPYAQYRAANAAQLNQLVANPSSITSGAGYQQGLNQALTGTQRQLAQTGQSMSGMGNYNMALTSGDYFNTQFQNQYSRLAQLSGATQNPSVGQDANAAQQKLQAASTANAERSLVAGIGGIQDLMKSYWG